MRDRRASEDLITRVEHYGRTPNGCSASGSFLPPGGRELRTAQSEGGLAPCPWSVGDEMSVVFDADAPDGARILSPLRSLTGGLLAIPLLFGAAGAYGLARARRATR